MKYLMPKGTITFHIPSKTSIPKEISWKQYLKTVGKKGYFCGYTQGDALCLVKGDYVIMIYRDQVQKIFEFKEV